VDTARSVDEFAACADPCADRSGIKAGVGTAKNSPDKRKEFTPEKGRPPPGGEEARVVVYQPRGVGLIHPRHKPSTSYYTHDSVAQRKCCLQEEGSHTYVEPAPLLSSRATEPCWTGRLTHSLAICRTVDLC
jgi:hypothetical protein